MWSVYIHTKQFLRIHVDIYENKEENKKLTLRQSSSLKKEKNIQTKNYMGECVCVCVCIDAKEKCMKNQHF